MEYGEKTGHTNGLSSRPVSGVGDFSDALGRARPAAFFLGPNSGPGAGSSLADAMQNRGRDGARCSPHIPRPATELAAGCSANPSPATAAATNRKGKPAAANSRPMPAYHQGATRVHSEDEEKRRVAVATEERKARERADKAAYELMMEEEAKPKEGPEEKSTKTVSYTHLTLPTKA